MEWKVMLEIFCLMGGIATVLAVLISPIIWVGSKIDSFRESAQKDTNEFRVEMRDCHLRLLVTLAKRK